MSTNTLAGQSRPLLASPPQLTAIDEEVGKQKEAEAQLEAERLWWAEASERQVKDLESTFGAEFEKTCSRLRSDILASQDRLEVLVEAEKRQRHASLADLRREIDEQQLVTKDLERKLTLGLQVFAEKHDGNASTGAGEAPTFDAIARAVERANQVEVEFERQKAEVRRLDVALSDLRKDFSSNSEHDQQLTEARLVDIQREVEALKEGRQIEKKGNEDTQALHQVITQSMTELARSIEDASAHATVAEQSLITRLQEMRRELESQDKKWCVEIFNAMEMSTNQLAKSIVNERELRTSDTSLLKARLDAALGQLEDLNVTARCTSASAAGSTSLPAHQPELAIEVEALRTVVDGIRNENSHGLSILQKQTEELASRITQIQASSPVMDSAGASVDNVMDVQGIIVDLRLELKAVKAALQANRGVTDGEPDAAGQTLLTRVDVLEAALSQTAQESDVRRLVAQVKSLAENEGQLSVRLENAETEIQKGAREIIPLAARMYAAESELHRVSRESGSVAEKVESLHTMVQCMDKKVEAMPTAVTTGVQGSQQSRPTTPQSAIPSLALDLKASLGNLVEKMNKTLLVNENSTATPLGSSSLPLTSEPAAAALMLGASSAGVANKEAGPPGNILEALQAVHELRERNLALREENAELAEELLAQDRLSPPGGSVRGLQWTPSAQQSACQTPMNGEGSTPQVAPAVGPPVVRGLSASGVTPKQETSTSPPTKIQGGHITGDPVAARAPLEARLLTVVKGQPLKPTISNQPAVAASVLSVQDHGLSIPRSLSRGRAQVRASNLAGSAVPSRNGVSGGLVVQSRHLGFRQNPN